MSDFGIIYSTVLSNEGGYNRPNSDGMQGKCGVGSGETYRGIDRNCVPQWPGWQIIDAYKQHYGIPASEAVINDATLENYVVQFYLQFLGRMVDVTRITHQTLANFVADFLVHKQYDAIKVMNAVASQFTPPPQTDVYKITDNVLYYMNTFAPAFYALLRDARIKYYQNPAQFGSSYKFSPALVAALINRVNNFPANI